MTQITYTLSIEDRVGRGMNVTERAVVAEGIGGYYPITGEISYNPNKDTRAFKENAPLDTSFSIVHPLRKVAHKLTQYYLANGGTGIPHIKYDSNVNDAQRGLFENILKQSFHKVEQKTIQALELVK